MFFAHDLWQLTFLPVKGVLCDHKELWYCNSFSETEIQSVMVGKAQNWVLIAASPVW